MVRVAAFVSKDARVIWHQPRLLFTLILGPFLILLIFGLGYQNEPRTYETLFVVPEGSQIEDYVKDYAESLGERIEFAGITTETEMADLRLQQGAVDLVVVTPSDPTSSWQENQQSTFSLYHREINPVEASYIRVMGHRYVEEINQQVLISGIIDSQRDAADWSQQARQAEDQATALREAIVDSDEALARRSAEQLQKELDLLLLAMGKGVTLMENIEGLDGSDEMSVRLKSELDRLRQLTGQLGSEGNAFLDRGVETAVEIESSLTEVNRRLQQFENIEPDVLVAPFRSETLTVGRVRLEPMHFYVPAVIALLLQHLAVTLAGLSVIQEKTRGAMEVFRAAPVSAFELLLGKYVGHFLLIAVTGAALTGLVLLALRVPLLGSWINYVVVLAALIFASLGVGYHISITARSESQAIQYGMLTLLAAIFFSGFFLPLYRLAVPVHLLSWSLPATYGTQLLQDVMLRGRSLPFWPALALIVLAVVLFATAWFRLARQTAIE